MNVRARSSLKQAGKGLRARRCLALVTVVGAFIMIASACSNQGEGERCEFLNRDEDCGDGLICYRAVQLRDTTSDRCCPRDRTKATHPVCQIGREIEMGDAETPPDTGPEIAPPEDDGGLEASADAPADVEPSSDAEPDGSGNGS